MLRRANTFQIFISLLFGERCDTMCSKNMKTNKDSLSAMLLLLPSLVLLLTPVTGDPLDKVCSNKTYTPNSPFENNLKGLLRSLSSNTNLTGFNSTSVGSNINQVHGRALIVEGMLLLRIVRTVWKMQAKKS